jgi:hypothetical protein
MKISIITRQFIITDYIFSPEFTNIFLSKDHVILVPKSTHFGLTPNYAKKTEYVTRYFCRLNIFGENLLE